MLVPEAGECSGTLGRNDEGLVIPEDGQGRRVNSGKTVLRYNLTEYGETETSSEDGRGRAVTKIQRRRGCFE